MDHHYFLCVRRLHLIACFMKRWSLFFIARMDGENDECAEGGMSMNMIKKILAPIDFSEAAIMLLQQANDIAEKFNARLTMVFVAEDPFQYSGLATETGIDPFDENIVQNARRQMKNFINENKDQLTVEFESRVITGHPAREIINYAAKEGIDLIIIGSHGYVGIDRMIFGSVAEKVIKLAPCPVLVINSYGDE
jgi:nucleotide-binding universal stress UspA family protein